MKAFCVVVFGGGLAAGVGAAAIGGWPAVLIVAAWVAAVEKANTEFVIDGDR